MLPVSLAGVSNTAELRVDPHFFVEMLPIEPLKLGISEGIPIAPPYVASVTNGVNIPESAYDLTNEAPSLVYASVAAISQFAFRIDRCVPLHDPKQHDYGFDLQSSASRSSEVLVSRSGTPGIACAAVAIPDDLVAIPSGFVIRIDCTEEILLPTYLAAVLNHPAWRLWSASLATGKRQRNLSQEHLASIRVPKLPLQDQRVAGANYLASINRITAILADDLDLMASCDEVIRLEAGLKFESLAMSKLTFDVVHLGDCAESPILRLDPRSHRSEVRRIISPLESWDCVPLADLVEDLIKGRQPSILSVDEPGNENRVIATVSVQDGYVAKDLTKPTTEQEIERAGARLVGRGDLLITMDGEGSIGKAAVFSDAYDAVPDSHVAILRLNRPSLAAALACYLNSSLGQAQIEIAISGSTGQTQITRGDLLSIRVPQAVIDLAERIAKQYTSSIRAYVQITSRIRREICVSSSHLSRQLIKSGSLTPAAKSFMRTIGTESALITLLGRLRPEMF
jgi:restriction endonuclease S subunit